MKVFRDLNIHADAATMAAAVAAMEQVSPLPWQRYRSAMFQSGSVANRRPVYGFSRASDAHRPGAILFIAERVPGEFFVSNVVPTERHQLAYDEYNEVLEDFYESVFKPVAERFDLEYTLTDPDAELEQWLDHETADLLRAFAATPNKGTAALHPNDRSRWHAFLYSAHENRSKLDSATLARWLEEVEGWPPEIAEQLALEYESGMKLLTYASHH